MEPPDALIERLRQRAEHERQARLEAEALAERSLRHLAHHKERLRLLQAITAAANEADTADVALQLALDTICAYTGWPVGHVYLAEGAPGPPRLVPTDLWHLPESGSYEALRSATAARPFASGEGLPGRVHATGRPAWVVDVEADSNFPRARGVEGLGVRSAFAFPVLLEREVAAVLEFFSPRLEEPNEALLELMAAVGVQLGRVMERERGQRELRQREAMLHEAQHLARIGSWRWELATDTVVWSDELYRIAGLEAGRPLSYEDYLSLLHPEDRPRLGALVERALREGTPYEITYRLVRPGGELRWVQSLGQIVRGEDGAALALQGTTQDVTERRAAEEEREHYAAELEERNAELEQFAYVASHDLQEPLRMVASFLGLLQRRYEGQLDERAHEYIAYAVDGAQRMQRLIQDLLAYSRIGTTGRPTANVDLNETLRTVRHDLRPLIEEAGATIEAGPLPTLEADPMQMRQLLQNLLGNALKFRHPERAPHVSISAERVEEDGESCWRLSVADNGIGIDPKYAERIFQVFQRLHPRERYEGTGIGLAICKKIAERRGGSIEVEGQPGEGTAFHVILPHPPPNAP